MRLIAIRLLLIRLLLIGLMLIACSPVEKLELPNTPGAKSTLLLFKNELSWSAEAIDRDRPALPLSIGGEVRAYALDYAVPLAELGLRPGPLALAPIGRPFPPPTVLLSRTFPEGNWSPAAPLDLAAVRIRDLGPDCEKLGGCFVKLNDEVYCEPDCVEPPEPEPPAEPTMPERPALEPCPITWIATTTTSELVVCLPPSLDCAAGYRRFLGDAGCTSEAAADWPTLTASATYVDPAAAPGGDGSMNRPLRTIAEAPAGGVIALHAGVYEEPGDLDGVSLHGSGPAAVVLRSAAPIAIRGNVVLEGLTIEGGVRIMAADLELDGVDLTAPAEVVTLEPGAVLRGRRVRIVDGARQIVALGAARIELEQSRLEGARVTAIAGDVASVRCVEVELAPKSGARGIVSRGVVDFHRSVLRGGTIGIELTAATASISQALLVDADLGLAAIDSDVRMTRAEISHGVRGLVATSTAQARDHTFVASHVVLRDFDATGAAFLGGEVDVDHLWVERAGELAVNAYETHARLSDVFTLATRPSGLGATSGQASGFGAKGGDLELRRWWVDECAGYGMLITQPDTDGAAPYRVVASDLTVYDVEKISLTDISRGQGILLGRFGTARLERVRTVDTGVSGVRVEDGSNVELRDVTISRTEIGLEDRQGAMLDVERMYIEEAESIGVLCQAYSAPNGSHARLSQLRIVDTSRAPDASDGVFLKINDAPPSTMTIDGFAISSMRSNGILIERDWNAEITNGRLENCGTGMHLDSILTDRPNIERGVIYRNNRENYRVGG